MTGAKSIMRGVSLVDAQPFHRNYMPRQVGSCLSCQTLDDKGEVVSADSIALYAALLSAGAILTGFCGTFLSFRIQREATYYRQPALDFQTGQARDVFIGLSHFTSSFLLLIIATLLAVVCGFILPLLSLVGAQVQPKLIVSGMVSSVVFVVGYFTCELVHYGVLNRKLLNDRSEWGRAWGVVSATVIFAAVAAAMVLGRGANVI